MTKIKLLLAMMTIIITVTTGSVAQALTLLPDSPPSHVLASVIGTLAISPCSLNQLILSPSIGSTDNDTVQCEFIVTSTNHTWGLYAAETLDGFAETPTLITEYEPGLAHTYGITANIIDDCDDTEVVSTGTNCNLTDAEAVSEFGIWFEDGPTGSDTIIFDDCDADNDTVPSTKGACPLEAPAQARTVVAITHPPTTTAAEGILLNVYASVNSTVTASPDYIDAMSLTISSY